MKQFLLAAAVSVPMAGSCVGQTVDNLLPNVQNQLASGIGWITKQKEDGTGPQPSAICSGFAIRNNQPTLTCSFTGDIKTGDLVVPSMVNFWGFAWPGYIDCSPPLKVECNQGYVTASRVVRFVKNQSITIQGELGGVSPAQSSPVTLLPIAPGELGQLPRGMDGWSKTRTLTITPDDFPGNSYPGTIRPLLVRKGVNGDEEYVWAVPTPRLNEFRGRTVTCEMAVWHKRQLGSGTWQVMINDDQNPGGFSKPGSGVISAGYEIRSVTHEIGRNAQSVVMGTIFSGASGDILYLAGPPTCAFGASLSPDQMHMNSNTKIRATGHWNPPLLTPYLIQFNDNCAPGLWCQRNIDMEAISFGTVHNSVTGVDAKVEWTTDTVGAAIFVGTQIDYLSFALEAHTPALDPKPPNHGVTADSSGTIDLYRDGTFILFTDQPHFTPITATFDFWDAYSAQPQ
jgi:hypothetical protein